MKNNVGFVLVALLAVALVVALVVTHWQAVQRQQQETADFLSFSNQLTQAEQTVAELRQVNGLLNQNLATNRVTLEDLSNNLATAADTATNLRNSLTASQDQVAGQTTRIADLQRQNLELNDRAAALASEAGGLSNTIATLNGQIDDTRLQLAESKTNNAYLQKQLQQLIEARAELEHQFNSLASVRAQVEKLEADVHTARRLRWIKMGTESPIKGAQLLMKLRDAPDRSASGGNYGLHAELGSDGSMRTVPPGSATATNNPATNAPSR